MGKPFPTRATRSRRHTCETHNFDTSSDGLSVRSQVRKLNGANIAASVLAIATSLVKTLNLASRLDIQARASAAFFALLLPRFQRQTQPLDMLGQGIIGQELGRHISRVLQSPDFPNLQFPCSPPRPESTSTAP